MKYTYVITYILFGIAWLLLLISMFLPQAGFLNYGFNGGLLSGWDVVGFVPVFALLGILSLLSGGVVPLEQFASISLFLSELLFLTSPLVLLKFKSGHLKGRSFYVLLNLVCLISLVPSASQVVSRLDPAINNEIQLLPGLYVWFGAQLALTLSAGVHWLND